MPERRGRPVPWKVGDLLGLCGSTLLGMILVGVAWFGASGATHVDSQVRWLNVGVAGVVILGAGNLVWLMTGWRATGELRRGVIPRIPVGLDAGVQEPVLSGRANGARVQLVAASAMSHFHLATCPLAAGKPVKPAALSTHRRRGLRPCGVCLEGAAYEAGDE